MSTDLPSARIQFVRDSDKGIRRVRSGRAFRYLDPQGRSIADKESLEYFRSLAIPPAWTNVWICPSRAGHIQATGRDAKGRKQYRYHAKYRARRDEAKFSNMVEFAKLLPKLRRKVCRDLRSAKLGQDKVLATVVRLLEVTAIRVGNAEYARDNGSFGLTTLRNKHVKPAPKGFRLCFQGKSGVNHEISVDDPALARIVRKCHDLPGYQLFQYQDEGGELHSVNSTMVNDYIREAMGADFTAKDFRTWHGTLEAFVVLCAMNPESCASGAPAAIQEAVLSVSNRLGNRPATCRKFYIHPGVLEAFKRGQLAPRGPVQKPPSTGLSSAERGVLRLLKAGKPR